MKISKTPHNSILFNKMYNHLMIILGVVFGCVGISVTVAIFYWYIRRASGTRTSEKSLGRKTFGYHQLGHRQIEHHASPSIPATAYLSPPNLLPTHVSYSSSIHNWYGNKELQKTDSNVTSFPKPPFLNFGKLPTANPHEIWAPTDLEKDLSRFGIGSSVDSTRSHGINQPLRTPFQPSLHYPLLDEIDHFGSVSDTKEGQDFSSRSCLPSCNNNDDLQVNSSLFTRINSSAGELSGRNQAFRISPNLIKDSTATGSTTRPPAVHLLPGAGSPDHTRPSQTSTSCTQLAPQATHLVLSSSWTTHIKCEFPSCERTFKHKHEYK